MNPLLRSSIAESIGTFTLTFIGAGAIITSDDLVVIALAHGLALSMAVYATGHISGGHINPAVTICMLVLKKIRAPAAAAYVIAQLAGASVAAFLLGVTFPSELVSERYLGATLGDLSLGSDAAPATVLVIEAVLTFFLITTIFAVAVDKRGPTNVYGFAIGLTIAFDILCAGPLTGASMNPARSFGPALAGGHWDIHWVYWAGPILGACVGGFLYDTFLIPLAEKEVESSES